MATRNIDIERAPDGRWKVIATGDGPEHLRGEHLYSSGAEVVRHIQEFIPEYRNVGEKFWRRKKERAA